MNDAISNLKIKKEDIITGFNDENRQAKIDIQHQKGKLTARERIDVLIDKGTFEEFGVFVECRNDNFGLSKQNLPCDGVITGYGKIFGRPVCVYSQDFTIAGGSLGEMHAKKITALQQKAIAMKCPIIALCDSGGARIQEGIDSLCGYGEIFQNNINSSGLIPQISVILGPCAGGAVYSPALTDFIFMSKGTSHMFVTGPAVVKKTIGEDNTFDELGGSEVHSKISGVADFVFDNDIETLQQVRKLFSFLPLSNNDNSNAIAFDNQQYQENDSNLLNSIVPDNNMEPYDMKIIIKALVDNGDFFEIKEEYAKNIITGFARIEGKTIGIVANQPMEYAGCLDIKSSRKGARFVRFCDAFNIPIITLIDVPGFLPGKDQEYNSIIIHGAKLLYAYGEASVPKISIITRKAYGGAYIVMGSKHLNCDLNYAWPFAEIAVMGAEQAGEILFKKHCNSEEEYQNKIKEYRDLFCNPYYAGSRGYIDDIIEPSKTREIICRGLDMLKNKTNQKIDKKHSNEPL